MSTGCLGSWKGRSTDTQEATCCAGKSIVQEATSVFLTLCPDLLFCASVYTLYEIRHLPCHGYSVATCGRILNRKNREIVQRGTVGTSRTSSAPRPHCTLLFSKSQIEKPVLDAHQTPFLLLISIPCELFILCVWWLEFSLSCGNQGRPPGGGRPPARL